MRKAYNLGLEIQTTNWAASRIPLVYFNWSLDVPFAQVSREVIGIRSVKIDPVTGLPGFVSAQSMKILWSPLPAPFLAAQEEVLHALREICLGKKSKPCSEGQLDGVFWGCCRCYSGTWNTLILQAINNELRGKHTGFWVAKLKELGLTKTSWWPNLVMSLASPPTLAKYTKLISIFEPAI